MQNLKYILVLLLTTLCISQDAFSLSKIVLGPNALRYKRNLVCPLKDKFKGFTSNFGYRKGRFHDGIDMRAAVNTNIYASHDGVVVYSTNKMSGYGNMVVIKGKGIMTAYSHNNRNLVRKGDAVDKGERIAFSGNTGRSTGPHLHFEIRIPVNKKWYAVNPKFFEVCK